jgi:hypothetical protein
MQFAKKPENGNGFVQVFFVPDKGNPGWSIVLQKEARGRRISSTEEDLCIGLEESNADRDVFTTMGGSRRDHGRENEEIDVARTFNSRTRARRE